MGNYVVYHLHTEQSLLDSCTNHKVYADRAAELGMKAICYTEHGNVFNNIEKCLYAQNKGLKFLYGIECYLTENITPKVRDNYHTILIAKNHDGMCEMNELIDASFTESHHYYKPRITFDEFLGLSDNVIKISACLASPLNKIRGDNPLINAYDYYEIQPHINSEDQKEYNRYLWELSKQTGIPLIAGTDTHSIDTYKAECRSILMKAKGIEFSSEDEFDLTWKTYDELVDMFRRQGALPEEVFFEAIENTNRMADSVEEIAVDTLFKYPVVDDAKEKLFSLSMEMYQDKIDRCIVQPDQRYVDNIREELRVFDKVGMCGFMYMMSDILRFCRENGIPNSPCRGSVGGSTIAYLTDITNVDPLVWGTVFSRFCNESRMEIGDIDIDVAPDQRDLVYDYIIRKFGDRNCAYILASGTLCDKATIDELGRALSIPLQEVAAIKVAYEKDAEKARKEYPDLFYYFDGLNGTVVSQSMHPAGIVVSPIDLVSEYGTFWNKGKRILSIDMEEIHDISLVKYDILSLANLTILRQTCELSGIRYPSTHEIDWCDQAVYNDMIKSPIGLFQFESPFAFDSLKKYKPKSVYDISLVTAAIRPSGESYRSRLLNHETNVNPSKQIDDLLVKNNGFLVYQEDVIAFLQNVCGLSGSEADNVRRAIGRKQMDRLEAALPAILEGYCSKSDKDRADAEKEAMEFLRIIEDSSNYMFGYNHSIGYSMVTYLCAYMRHYHPIEFVTAYMNNCKTDEDTAKGVELAQLKGIKIMPIRFGKSRSGYFMDKESNAIYKGLTSVKYISAELGEELYTIARREKPSTFTDLLFTLNDTTIDSRQLNILIDLGYFADYGNANELETLQYVFENMLKSGEAKSIKRERVPESSDLYCAIAAHSDGKKKDGTDAASWKIRDCRAVMADMEMAILARHMPDFDTRLKMKWQREYLGHISATGRDEDRSLLVVTDKFPLRRKADGRLFGYSIVTTSVGSGKSSRFTVFCNVWNRCGEINKDDLIRCLGYERDGQYFRMTNYRLEGEVA